ncbi:MAG: VWA domain-containing protein [Bryobacterales bacterium]|nr:VWA domain-containing protein [Acidobacteriota bacterium]MCB9383962.1 VWA domain-containing protein [Bryobacterales bacterium]
MKSIRILAAAALALGAAGSIQLLQPPALGQNLGGDNTLFSVDVDLVVLNIAVTDRRGHYITDLKPQDFRVLEDGIEQQLATFGAGNAAPVQVSSLGTRQVDRPDDEQPAPGEPEESLPVGDAFAGANVFILFDTSNFMYRSFVYAEDAIADFIRGLDQADSVALYGFSRNLTRHAGLTDDRLDAIKGLRRSVAGDETALYNSLLLTLRDAAKVSGRKVVIVFSNGPDTASTVGPDDVGAIAEDEGIPIYVISTKELNKDPISSNAFRRITARTGGRAYFAKTWQRQSEAFVNIREELASSYTLTYYPQPNPNRSWRNIEVSLVGGDNVQRYRIRTRNGYRPKL